MTNDEIRSMLERQLVRLEGMSEKDHAAACAVRPDRLYAGRIAAAGADAGSQRGCLP